MNHQVVIVFLCYSINPFIRKNAITHLNDCTGYALVQFTTAASNSFYLLYNWNLLYLEDIKFMNLKYAVCSSSLTFLSSYYLTKLLKENSTSDVMTQVQVFTILSSFLIDYLFNNLLLTNNQIIGIFLLVYGIILSKNDTK